MHQLSIELGHRPHYWHFDIITWLFEAMTQLFIPVYYITLKHRKAKHQSVYRIFSVNFAQFAPTRTLISSVNWAQLALTRWRVMLR